MIILLVWFGLLSGHFFRKELFIRLAMCSHCISFVCGFGYFPVCFGGGVWFLIAPIPVHCLLVTFTLHTCAYKDETVYLYIKLFYFCLDGRNLILDSPWIN